MNILLLLYLFQISLPYDANRREPVKLSSIDLCALMSRIWYLCVIKCIKTMQILVDHCMKSSDQGEPMLIARYEKWFFRLNFVVRKSTGVE